MGLECRCSVKVGLKRLSRIVSERAIKDKVTTEPRCYISSLPRMLLGSMRQYVSIGASRMAWSGVWLWRSTMTRCVSEQITLPIILPSCANSHSMPSTKPPHHARRYQDKVTLCGLLLTATAFSSSVLRMVHAIVRYRALSL